jgi:hypothetical protein
MVKKVPTIDYRELMKLRPTERRQVASTLGEELRSKLTPSQYAALFPGYYKNMMPKGSVAGGGSGYSGGGGGESGGDSSGSGSGGGYDSSSEPSSEPSYPRPPSTAPSTGSTAPTNGRKQPRPGFVQPDSGSSGPTAAPAKTNKANNASISGGRPGPNIPPSQSRTNYASHLRKDMFAELDKNPKLKDQVIRMMRSENGSSVAGMTSVLESAANRNLAEKHGSLNKTLHNGFYGPINSGRSSYTRPLTKKEREMGEQAIKSVREGSNRIEWRSDQGMPSDPGSATYMRNPSYWGWKKIDGEHFAYKMEPGRKWALEQQKKEKEWNENIQNQPDSEGKPATKGKPLQATPKGEDKKPTTSSQYNNAGQSPQDIERQYADRVKASKDYLKSIRNDSQSGNILKKAGYDNIDIMNNQASVKMASALKKYNDHVEAHPELGLHKATINSAGRFPMKGMPGGFADKSKSIHASGGAFDISVSGGGLDNHGKSVDAFAEFAKSEGLIHGKDVYGAHEGHHWNAYSGKTNPFPKNAYDKKGIPKDLEMMKNSSLDKPGEAYTPTADDVSPDKLFAPQAGAAGVPEAAKGATDAAKIGPTPPPTATPAGADGAKLEPYKFGIRKPDVGSGKEVATTAERKAMQASGGTYVSLDTNSATGQTRLDPMFVYPDNASDAQKAMAQRTMDDFAARQNERFPKGRQVKGKIVSRSQNGNGRTGTFHLESFNINDKELADFYSSPEGKAMMGDVLTKNMNEPGVEFALPHLTSRTGEYNPKARGAAGNGTDEVTLGQGWLEDIQSKVDERNKLIEQGGGTVSPTQNKPLVEGPNTPDTGPAPDPNKPVEQRGLTAQHPDAAKNKPQAPAAGPTAAPAPAKPSAPAKASPAPSAMPKSSPKAITPKMATGGSVRGSSEEIDMYDKRSKRKLGEIRRGENVRFDQSGKAQVTPDRRVDPRKLEGERESKQQALIANSERKSQDQHVPTSKMDKAPQNPGSTDFGGREQWGAQPTNPSFVRAMEQARGKKSDGGYKGSRYGEDQNSAIS